jgi:GNAT superfamily N-acetyltransferase
MMTHLWLGSERVGYVTYDNDRPEGLYLQWTYLEPAYRLQGYWRNTVAAVIKLAHDAGKPVFIDFVDKVTKLSPTPYVTNDFSREFYQGFGFRELFRYGSENERTRLVLEPPGNARDTEPSGARNLLIEDLLTV